MFHLVLVDISKTTKFKPSKKLHEQLAKVGTILIGNPNLCKGLLDTQLHMCAGLNEPFQLFLELAIGQSTDKNREKMTNFSFFSISTFLGIYIW